MNQPLLYRPRTNWTMAAALIAAVLLHAAAVVVAEFRPPAAISSPLDPAPPEVVVSLDPAPADEAPPPPEPEELPPPPIEVPAHESFIPEDDPSPPPLRPRLRESRPPLVRPPAAAASGGIPRLGSGKVVALSAPRLEYPYEARRQRTTGSGVVLLTIDAGSGRVTDVRMLRSTGSAVLDQAAITGFRRWRFAPGTVTHVQAPITYTLSGASY